MNVSIDQPDADHPDLADLIEQLNAKLEAGESVDLEHLLKEHPQHAEQIQSLLPAITALMGLATPATRNEGVLAPDSSNGDGELRRLGDFRIGREIGRGGMGIVYEAEQISMTRRVALKVLPLAGLVDELKIRRFQNEVRAVASLNHPNIVPVYMVGEERGVHYYAMQLIRGRSLSEVLSSLRHDRDEGSPIDGSSMSRNTRIGIVDDIAEADVDTPTELFAGDSQPNKNPKPGKTVAKADSSTIPHASRREYFCCVAELGIQAATALQHAHDEGIIHRDIKPANLLLDSSLKLYVTDFGLARIESDVGVTMTGDLIGTLRYMAPEQALAKRVVVDHRADIYSLAATLYELLTLRPAYVAQDRQQLLKQIAFEEPTPLRRVDKDIPVELETIIQKAMSKDMAQRYSSAQELAEDLRLHLEHRPIKARPPTLSHIIVKWTGRNPVILSAAALIGITLFVATLVSSVLAIREYEARQNESTERKRAVQAERQAIAAAERNRRLSYLSDINLAHQVYKAGDLARATRLLMRFAPTGEEEDLRGFEWYYLWNVCPGRSVRAIPRVGRVEVAFSPDDRTFATGGSDGMVQIWDRNTLERRNAWPVEPDPYSHYRSIDVLYSPSGKILAGLFRGGYFRTQGRVVLFDVDTGESRVMAPGSPDNVIRAAFKEDGNTLATAETNGQIRFWNASTGQPAGNPKQLASDTTWRRAAFSSDLRLLAAGGPKGQGLEPGAGQLQVGVDVQVKVYDIETGRVVSELETDDSILGKLQFTEDNRFLVNPGSPPFGRGKLVIWKLETGEEVFSTTERRTYSGIVSISTDLIAVGGPDSISFVNPSKGVLVDRWEGVPGAVIDLAVSSDGKQLASTGWDGLVRLWDLPRQQNPKSVELEVPTTRGLRFSPSGDMLASAHSGRVVLRYPVDFKAAYRLDGQTRPAFSPVGDFLATVSADGFTIHLWDYRSGQPTGKPVSLEGHQIQQMAFSADGKRIGCATKSGAVIVLNLEDPTDPQTKFDIASSANHYLAFGNRDGQELIAIPAGRRSVKLVDLENGREEQTLEGPMTQIYGVDFSSDGSQLVSWGHDIFVWNTISGEVELGIEENTGATLQAAFSPDGTSILTRGFKGNLGLWDLQSGREKMRLLEEWDQTPHSVTFSPDGSRIVAGVNDNALMVWSAPRVDSTARAAREAGINSRR